MALQIIFDLFLNFADAAKQEVLDLFTGDTDKVMVMTGVPAEVVVELAVRVDDLDEDAAVGEVFEIAVDRRKAYALKTFLHPLPYLFRPQVS